MIRYSINLIVNFTYICIYIYIISLYYLYPLVYYRLLEVRVIFLLYYQSQELAMSRAQQVFIMVKCLTFLKNRIQNGSVVMAYILLYHYIRNKALYNDIFYHNKLSTLSNIVFTNRKCIIDRFQALKVLHFLCSYHFKQLSVNISVRQKTESAGKKLKEFLKY